MDLDRVWTGLATMQAAGLACVVCGCPLKIAAPVGRSETGGQVLACAGSCLREARQQQG